MMEAYIQRVLNIYSDDTMDDLHDKLDQARQRIAKADEDYMRSGLSAHNDTLETASNHFYTLQMVIRHREEQ